MTVKETWLVTGGLGFIGSNFIHMLAKKKEVRIINVDKQSYAADKRNLRDLKYKNFKEITLDITNEYGINKIFKNYNPTKVIHFAASSHVDKSIKSPDEFIHDNITGTYRLLKKAKDHYDSLSKKQKEKFLFVGISTDEVMGSLKENDFPFNETSQYEPNSVYSASKAAADHLIRSFGHTFGLPYVITNCSNNYGPRQNKEKLIPKVILCALNNKKIPVYGKGNNIRDWIHVDDHCEAIYQIIKSGAKNERYLIGGENEVTNMDIVNKICDIVDEIRPLKKPRKKTLIEYVADRPGHDFRYAISNTKITKEIGWTPKVSFEQGLRETISWYIEHRHDEKLFDNKTSKIDWQTIEMHNMIEDEESKMAEEELE